MAEDEHQRSIFIVCPIGGRDSAERKRANQVKKHLIEPAFEGFKIKRSDLSPDPGSISHEIVTSIREADLVIIDMTGHNPNVFYEMAIAHGFRRACIHMIQDGEKIPFDVNDMRAIVYDLTDPDRVVESRDLMKQYGRAAMANPEATLTPLSRSDAFNQISHSDNPLAMVIDTMNDNISRLTAQVGDLAHRGDRPYRIEKSSVADHHYLRKKDAALMWLVNSQASSTIPSPERDRLMREVMGARSFDSLDVIMQEAIALKRQSEKMRGTATTSNDEEEDAAASAEVYH